VDEKGELLMDEVFRFEALPEAVDAISQRLGIPTKGMPIVNGQGLPLNYRAQFTPEMRKAVEDKYGAFIERFQYTF